MEPFTKDQLEALVRYHKYRYYEELGWTAMLLFFVVYGLTVFRMFVQRGIEVPLVATVPILIGAGIYIIYQLFGAAILISRVHDSGVEHSGDPFKDVRIGWFSIYSPLAIALGLIVLITGRGIYAWAVFFASGIIASAISRATLLQRRYRYIEQLIEEQSQKKVKHLEDVIKQ